MGDIEPCPECAGTGYWEHEGADGMPRQDGCDACDGTGLKASALLAAYRGAVEERERFRAALELAADNPADAHSYAVAALGITTTGGR